MCYICSIIKYKEKAKYMIKKTIDVDKLINWAELSRTLSGTRCVVRKKSIPEIHQSKVDKLRKAIKDWHKSL